MDFLESLASHAVAVVSLATIAWPLNVPLMALAYRVYRGTRPLDVESFELWQHRPLIAAAGPAVLSAVLLLLLYLGVMVAKIGGPQPVALVLYLGYLPAGIAYVTWAWGLDEMVEGIGIFLLYLLLPFLPLYLVGRWTGLWRALAESAPWLST